jgi:hypothetical protein
MVVPFYQICWICGGFYIFYFFLHDAPIQI